MQHLGRRHSRDHPVGSQFFQIRFKNRERCQSSRLQLAKYRLQRNSVNPRHFDDLIIVRNQLHLSIGAFNIIPLPINEQGGNQTDSDESNQNPVIAKHQQSSFHLTNDCQLEL